LQQVDLLGQVERILRPRVLARLARGRVPAVDAAALARLTDEAKLLFWIEADQFREQVAALPLDDHLDQARRVYNKFFAPDQGGVRGGAGLGAGAMPPVTRSQPKTAKPTGFIWGIITTKAQNNTK
jgi:hypothetical protein